MKSYCGHCGQWFDHEPVQYREATFCSRECVSAILLLCEQERRKIIDHASSSMSESRLQITKTNHPHDSV